MMYNLYIQVLYLIYIICIILQVSHQGTAPPCVLYLLDSDDFQAVIYIYIYIYMYIYIYIYTSSALDAEWRYATYWTVRDNLDGNRAVPGS
jgi:hypothetical protein